MTDTVPPALQDPVTASQPCGPSLEYDSEYLLLLARLEPRAEVQYGSFVGAADTPDWSAIERDAQRLLARSRDIALLVCRCRAATRLRQAAGLAEGLGGLRTVLQAWPEAVHPQTVIDGSFDPSVRANALAALADRDGLLGDVAALLASLLSASRPPEAATRQALASAAAHAVAIDRWARENLAEQAPTLQPLLLALAPHAGAAGEIPAPPFEAPPEPAGGAERFPDPPEAPGRSRAEMRAVLADVRAWFETHEPSSPVADLLEQAENLIGLRYGQLLPLVSPELLRQWAATRPGQPQVRP